MIHPNSSIPSSPLPHNGQNGTFAMNPPYPSNTRFSDEDILDDLSSGIGEGGSSTNRVDKYATTHNRASFYQRGLRHSMVDFGGETGQPKNIVKASTVVGPAYAGDSFDIVDKQESKQNPRKIANPQYVDYTGGIFLKSNDLGLI